MEKIVESKDYSYTDINRIITKLSQRYSFFKTASIGNSVLGKKLFALQIGTSENPTLFCGAFHGSERITGTLLLKFAEDMCESIEKKQNFAGFIPSRIFENKSLIIVPFVNPDGCEIARNGPAAAGNNTEFIRKISNNNTLHYNANARGVDLNHNFPAGWDDLHELEQQNGIYAPSITRYGGEKPLSEPETTALVKLCEKIAFCRVLAFHSQGEVIYHNYKKYLPQAQKQAELLAVSSGYVLQEPEGLAVGGGFKDYFIQEYSKPAFTVEVGKGENPLNPNELNNIYDKIKKMLVLATMM